MANIICSFDMQPPYIISVFNISSERAHDHGWLNGTFQSRVLRPTLWASGPIESHMQEERACCSRSLPSNSSEQAAHRIQTSKGITWTASSWRPWPGEKPETEITFKWVGKKSSESAAGGGWLEEQEQEQEEEEEEEEGQSTLRGRFEWKLFSLLALGLEFFTKGPLQLGHRQG